MINALKWFWTNISFRNWTFEGYPMISLWFIMWKLFWTIPILVTLGLFSITVGLVKLKVSAMKTTWWNNI